MTTIVLHDERPKSWNVFYAGKHWQYRRLLVEEVRQKVKIACYQQGINPVSTPLYGERVNIKLTAFYKKNHIDSDNIPAKLYIDALKQILLKDDSPTYVGSVTTRSEKITDDTPTRLEIEITPDTI